MAIEMSAQVDENVSNMIATIVNYLIKKSLLLFQVNKILNKNIQKMFNRITCALWESSIVKWFLNYWNDGLC